MRAPSHDDYRSKNRSLAGFKFVARPMRRARRNKELRNNAKIIVSRKSDTQAIKSRELGTYFDLVLLSRFHTTVFSTRAVSQHDGSYQDKRSRIRLA